MNIISMNQLLFCKEGYILKKIKVVAGFGVEDDY